VLREIPMIEVRARNKMPAERRTGAIYGALAGFTLSGMVAGVAWLNRGRSDSLQTVTNFFSAFPIYLARDFSIAENVFYVLFFAYWSCLGGVLGWLISASQRADKRMAGLLLLVIAGLHTTAQLYLETEIATSIKAIFRGMFP
jgi:hypothetical protein